MSEKLVTAEAFTNPSRAELAKQRLEAAGIPAYLNGAEAGGAFPGLGGEVGTIKLEVREDDVERVRELLAAPPVPAEAAEADEPEEPPEDPESTEALARRAWRAALFGLMFLWVILHIYSLWLLLKLSFRPDDVSPEGMRKVYGALVIDGFVLVAFAVVLRAMFEF